jgi:flagellar assembly protein FliH
MAGIIKHHRVQPADQAAPPPPPPPPAEAVFVVPVNQPRSTGYDDDLPFSLDPASAERLQAARQRAAAIIAEAATAAEHHRQLAYDEGFQAGLANGQAAAEQMIDQSILRLQALANTATIDRATLIRDAEQHLLNLALAVAATIIQREVSLDPTIVVNTLNAVMSHIQNETVTVWRVHPSDLATVSRWWSERSHTPAERQVRILADPRVEAGGCLVETTTGAWDATLESQLEHIRQAFNTIDRGTP